MRIGFACPRIRAGAFRGAATGKARYRQIEASPEEMHGAGFPDEARAKFLANRGDAREDAPAAIRVFGIVGGVLRVFVEADRIRDFDWHRPDLRVDLDRSENGCKLAVEIRDRARREKNRLVLIAARRDSEHVIDEVKFEREDSQGVRNGQCGQAARADVERFGPAVIHFRAQR